MNKIEHAKQTDEPHEEMRMECVADGSVSQRHQAHDGSAFDSVSGVACRGDSPIPLHRDLACAWWQRAKINTNTVSLWSQDDDGNEKDEMNGGELSRWWWSKLLLMVICDFLTYMNLLIFWDLMIHYFWKWAIHKFTDPLTYIYLWFVDLWKFWECSNRFFLPIRVAFLSWKIDRKLIRKSPFSLRVLGRCPEPRLLSSVRPCKLFLELNPIHKGSSAPITPPLDTIHCAFLAYGTKISLDRWLLSIKQELSILWVEL